MRHRHDVSTHTLGRDSTRVTGRKGVRCRVTGSIGVASDRRRVTANQCCSDYRLSTTRGDRTIVNIGKAWLSTTTSTIRIGLLVALNC